MKWKKPVKIQLSNTVFMTFLGLCVCAYSQSYLSAFDRPVKIEARKEAYLPVAAEKMPATPPDAAEEADQEFRSSLTAFNLAFLYPKGNTVSLGTKAAEQLSKMESEWLSSIYELTVMEPYKAAVHLGMGGGAYEGVTWNKVEISFYDENRNLISARSNIQDILSMANTYFYYVSPEDYVGFMNYAYKLFESSHSVSFTISDVYFCDGSLDEEEEEDGDFQNDIENDIALAAGAVETFPEKEASETGGPETGNSQGAPDLETTEGAGEETLSGEAYGPGVSTSPESQSFEEVMETGLHDSWEAGKESVTAMDTKTSSPPECSTASAEAAEQLDSDTLKAEDSLENGVSTEGGEIAPAAAPTGETIVQSEAAVSSEALSGQKTPLSQEVRTAGTEETKEIGPGIGLLESNTPLETSSVTEETTEPPPVCPGHADLHITAVIKGISDSGQGLFALDSIGNETVSEGKWEGWTEENKNYALQLSNQDWTGMYGLTLSPSFIMSPLSSEEIAGYMEGLPEDLSQERRKLIQYALSSVGRVPYYWGGKPGRAGYEGNHFGSLITPDHKGRSMKGLDCSGWINWVYWSALGRRLPCENTGGLSVCGTSVKREDLKPGDIILKTGEAAHVVMFLSWAGDGRMRVIHESSAAVNNVTVSTMEANWPYYRKLIE